MMGMSEESPLCAYVRHSADGRRCSEADIPWLLSPAGLRSFSPFQERAKAPVPTFGARRKLTFQQRTMRHEYLLR
jgi:hypothetical protein